MECRPPGLRYPQPYSTNHYREIYAQIVHDAGRYETGLRAGCHSQNRGGSRLEHGQVDASLVRRMPAEAKQKSAQTLSPLLCTIWRVQPCGHDALIYRLRTPSPVSPPSPPASPSPHCGEVLLFCLWVFRHKRSSQIEILIDIGK